MVSWDLYIMTCIFSFAWVIIALFDKDGDVNNTANNDDNSNETNINTIQEMVSTLLPETFH